MNTKSTVAIVTGAGRRLGRHIALALGEHGYTVVVNYHESREGAREVVKAVKDAGGQATAIRADVSRRSDVERLVGSTLSEFGRIDLLVNNAAIFVESSLEKISDSLWDRTLGINLKGTFLCSQAVSTHMARQKGGGKIINIASLGGLQAWRDHIPYSVSKAGVIMLTRCLAKALAPRIAVNAIAPGTIIMEDEGPEIKHIPKGKILMKRYGDPSDIVGAVLYLATVARYVTGQVFVVDGGRSVV